MPLQLWLVGGAGRRVGLLSAGRGATRRRACPPTVAMVAIIDLSAEPDSDEEGASADGTAHPPPDLLAVPHEGFVSIGWWHCRQAYFIAHSETLEAQQLEGNGPFELVFDDDDGFGALIDLSRPDAPLVLLEHLLRRASTRTSTSTSRSPAFSRSPPTCP